MIQGIFHEGSGLGNQLFRYVFTRVKAKDLGCKFSMYGNFKGRHFMDIDLGSPLQPLEHVFEEERVNDSNGVDIRPYDAKSEQIQPSTLVDGEFQDERYFMHRIKEVRQWLKVKPLRMADDLCVINFRGGEYVGVPDLFLPKDYWDLCIDEMLKINPKMRFEVHTDDKETARLFFPDYEIIQDMEINWRSIRYAKYLILSNSSFAILPALLGNAKKILAPKYWARRNLGFWALPQNNYSKFTYL